MDHFFLLSTSTVFGQRAVLDSLLKRAEVVTDPYEKVDTYVRITSYYRDVDIDSAVIIVEKAEKLAEKLDDPHKMAAVYNTHGILQKYLNDFDSAEELYLRAMELYKEAEEPEGVSTAYNNLGSLEEDRGNYSKALDYYFEALAIDEKYDFKDNLANSYNNIGLIHYNMGDYDQAMGYYKQSLEIRKELGDSLEFAIVYNNIGILYYFKEEYEKTLEYFKMALEIWEQYDKKRMMTLPLYNIAELYMELYQHKQALDHIKKAISINEELRDTFELISSYTLCAQIYQKRNNLQQAELYFEKAVEFTKATESLSEQMEAYGKLATFYEETGQIGKALEFFKKYQELNDSIYDIKKTEAMADLQAKYEDEKKQAEIEKQKEINKKEKAEKEKAQAENDKKDIQMIFLIVGLGLTFVLGVVVYTGYKRKKKDNTILREKNAQINQQKEEITAQRDEIEAQRDEIEAQRDQATEQRDLIGKQKKALDDSIVYAERIQSAMLPSQKMLDECLKEHFLMFLPRDVVSGDFFWSTCTRDKIIVAVGDCTGHGVPGAFMSMLGISYLNEIVKKEQIMEPDEVLNRLRQNVISSLRQELSSDADLSSYSTVKDGMDISLIVYDTASKTVKYAGANNPVYLVRDHSMEQPELHEDTRLLQGEQATLYELKPDKMPIAIYNRMNAFRSQTWDLKKGDMIYMFSDGFADQFGGTGKRTGMKYKYKPFKRFLLDISGKNPDEQLTLLQKEFNRWKGDFSQLDDVVVLGFRVE